MKVAFYSYKGGVGRTKLMVGVGALLAMKGYRVSMLDFDLHASGLATMLRADKKKIGKRELLEILLNHREDDVMDGMLNANSLLEQRFGEAPPDPGILKFLPTISNPILSSNVDLKSMDDEIERLLDSVLNKTGVDILLIDVAPGYSVSSTVILPKVNHAVVVTRLDTQNIAGLQEVMPVFRDWSKLNLIPVCNMMIAHPQAKERIERLEKVFKHPIDVRIDYDPELLFDDDIECLAQPKSSVRSSLEKLIEILVPTDNST